MTLLKHHLLRRKYDRGRSAESDAGGTADDGLKMTSSSPLFARTVKLYVYDVPKSSVLFHKLAQASSFCSRGQWASEVHFHEWLMQAASVRTLDPEEADYFFVPGYAICIFEGGFLSLPNVDAAYRELVATELPFFKGRERQHIFSFASGMGILTFFSWQEVLPESIFLTPETSLYNDFPHVVSPAFASHKDIAIPGYLHRSEIASLTAAAKPVAEKRFTVVFFGRVDPSRGVHPALGGKDVRNEIVRVLEKGKNKGWEGKTDGSGGKTGDHVLDAEKRAEIVYAEDIPLDDLPTEALGPAHKIVLSETRRDGAGRDPHYLDFDDGDVIENVIERAADQEPKLFKQLRQSYEDVFVGYTDLTNMHSLMGDSR